AAQEHLAAQPEQFGHGGWGHYENGRSGRGAGVGAPRAGGVKFAVDLDLGGGRLGGGGKRGGQRWGPEERAGAGRVVDTSQLVTSHAASLSGRGPQPSTLVGGGGVVKVGMAEQVSSGFCHGMDSCGVARRYIGSLPAREEGYLDLGPSQMPGRKWVMYNRPQP